MTSVQIRSAVKCFHAQLKSFFCSHISTNMQVCLITASSVCGCNYTTVTVEAAALIMWLIIRAAEQRAAEQRAPEQRAQYFSLIKTPEKAARLKTTRMRVLITLVDHSFLIFLRLRTSNIVAHTGVLITVTRRPLGADGSGGSGPTGYSGISRSS